MDRIQFELDSSISQYTNNYKKTFDKMNMTINELNNGFLLKQINSFLIKFYIDKFTKI